MKKNSREFSRNENLAGLWVEVTKLNLGQDSEARFGQDFKFKLSGNTDVWLRF